MQNNLNTNIEYEEELDTSFISDDVNDIINTKPSKETVKVDISTNTTKTKTKTKTKDIKMEENKSAQNKINEVSIKNNNKEAFTLLLNSLTSKFKEAEDLATKSDLDVSKLFKNVNIEEVTNKILAELNSAVGVEEYVERNIVTNTLYSIGKIAGVPIGIVAKTLELIPGWEHMNAGYKGGYKYGYNKMAHVMLSVDEKYKEFTSPVEVSTTEPTPLKA